mgnify:CR=1 FL=1
MALARQPDVLLLDEPTSALDATTTLLVESSIKKSGAMCVWVTHNDQQQDRVALQTLTIHRGGRYEVNDRVPV